MARKPSPNQNRPAQPEQAGAPPRQNRMLRFLVLFPIFLAVGFCALMIPFLHSAVTAFTRGLVEVSALVIRLFGGNATAQQVVLQTNVSQTVTLPAPQSGSRALFYRLEQE